MSRSIAMRLFSLLALLAAALVLLGSLASGASPPCACGHAKPTKWRIDSTELQAPVQTSPGWPFEVGATSVVAGSFERHRTAVKSGKTSIVRGATVKHSTVTGHPTPNVVTLEGTARNYQATSSHLSRFQVTVTIQPDLSITISGTGQFVSGTGEQRDVSGHYTIQGSAPTPSAPQTIHAVGIIRY